jgi:hypothetical protein
MLHAEIEAVGAVTLLFLIAITRTLVGVSRALTQLAIRRAR